LTDACKLDYSCSLCDDELIDITDSADECSKCFKEQSKSNDWSEIAKQYNAAKLGSGNSGSSSGDNPMESHSADVDKIGGRRLAGAVSASSSNTSSTSNTSKSTSSENTYQVDPSDSNQYFFTSLYKKIYSNSKEKLYEGIHQNGDDHPIHKGSQYMICPLNIMNDFVETNNPNYSPLGAWYNRFDIFMEFWKEHFINTTKNEKKLTYCSQQKKIEISTFEKRFRTNFNGRNFYKKVNNGPKTKKNVTIKKLDLCNDIGERCNSKRGTWNSDQGKFCFRERQNQKKRRQFDVQSPQQKNHVRIFIFFFYIFF